MNVYLVKPFNKIRHVSNYIIDEEKFTEVLRKVIREELEAMPKSETQLPGEERYLRSMNELAEFLGCSVVTAQKFKNVIIVAMY